jgi:uncharacterized protein
MSKPFCDLHTFQPAAGPVFFQDIDLPGAPPPSPNGRVLYENLGIRIDRDGTWHYHGSPIQRKELLCLFACALTRDAAGQHWLVTPAEMGPIEVEDAAFLAVEAFVAGAGEQQLISVRTNVDEIVTISNEHPLHLDAGPEDGELRLYVRLNKRLEAKLSRALYYDLVALGVEAESDGRPCLGVWSGGRLFPLGWLDEAS